MLFQKSRARKAEPPEEKIERLRDALRDAEAVLIGAGAGLSAAAGFTYEGERFQRYFADFGQKYGFCDMYSGGFYPYESMEEYWAYWSRYIFHNRYEDAPKPVYQDLLGLVRGKEYFVLTTNVDQCFEKAGFEKGRLFYTQGDYGLFQCSGPCCQKTCDNESIIREMVERQREMKIPAELVPHCPHCGRPLTMNLRADDSFVQDEGWYQAAERYHRFLQRNEGRRLLLLELGVGYNTPGIIKYPFWRMAANNPDAVYACVNRGQSTAPEEIARQSICIDADIGAVLAALCGNG